MAPLTRMRATNPERAPTALHAEYYAQRATAGLIISEGTFVSPASVGWARVPGLWSAAHVVGWRLVTEAVHRVGGRIFVQLWHTGSLSHPDFYDGELPPAPSAVNPGQKSVTPTGKKDTVIPREMTARGIRDTVRDFGHAARNAMEAGFDGVQIQGGFHYLFNQFLHPGTNLRRDAYGGSIENRARFLFEVLEEVGGAVDRGRIGVKTGPATLETGAFVSGDETLPTFEYVIDRLNHYELSHLLLMGQMADLSATPIAHLRSDEMFRPDRPGAPSDAPARRKKPRRHVRVLERLAPQTIGFYERRRQRRGRPARLLTAGSGALCHRRNQSKQRAPQTPGAPTSHVR